MVTDGEPRRLHPGTIALNVIRGAPGFVFGIPAFLAFARDFDLWLAGLIGVGLAAIVGVFQFLSWWRFTYQLTDDAVVVQSGVLSHNRRTIPFDRVQDVDIERKLLARLFGLARVNMETGGAGENEGALDSVSMAEAERLRGVIRKRAAQAHAEETPGADGDATIPTVETDSPVLFSMPLGRVLYSGLFRFSLVWLAVIGGAFQYLDDWVPWGNIEVDDLRSRAEAASATAEAAFVAGVTLSVIFILFLLGVVAGILRTLLREYGFALTDEGGRYRRVRGLLTRTEAVIALRRVQLAVIENGFVMRLLGWAGLKLQTLGSGEKGEGGRQDVAPFARDEEIDEVLAPLNIERADPDALTRVSTMHVVRMVITRIGWMLMPIVALVIARANLAEAAVFLAVLMGLFLFLLVPVGIVAALQRGHHRYGLIGRTFHVQRGVLGQKKWIVPARNIQAITVRRTWLQRRLGTASVYSDTAGASMISTPSVEDVRPGEAWALVDAIRPLRRMRDSLLRGNDG